MRVSAVAARNSRRASLEQDLTILHLEDQPADTALVRELLRREGLSPRIDRVETLEEFAHALSRQNYSLVLSDYSLPAADPIEALRLARQHHPALPFIFLSGTLGEELAIDMLKLGATDYVLKHRISRLVPAVRRALHEKEELARRQQAEAALRDSEARFRSFVESTNQVIWRTNPRGEVDQPNPSWNAFTGQTTEQAAGFGWLNATHPEDHSRIAEAWNRARSAQAIYQVEYRLRRHDGQWRYVLTRGVPIFQSGQVLEYIGTCMDVTEQRQIDLQLERQAKLIDLSPTATIVRSPEGRITFWSAGAQSLYGWAPQEALGHLTHDLLQTRFPQPFPEILAQLRPGGTWSGELRQRTKAGSEVTVESHWLGLFGPDGRLFELLESNMDITARKRAEEKLVRLKEELSQANRDLEAKVQQRTAKLSETVAELEALSYALVHDLRAPLRAMQSYADIVQEEAAHCLQPGQSGLLSKIRVASSRMDHLITDSLNYTTILRQNLPLGDVNLGRLLRGMVETYPNFHPPQADIAIEFGDLLVQGNEAALTQVFSNLLANAVKFVAPGTHPRVRIWAEFVESGKLIVDSPTPSGHQLSTLNPQLVRVFVQDNGIGIPPERQGRIFDLFQRLHHEDEYPGTGIGLALVRKSLERMGGRVALDSEPGKGSCFWVELPAAAAPHLPSAATVHNE